MSTHVWWIQCKPRTPHTQPPPGGWCTGSRVWTPVLPPQRSQSRMPAWVRYCPTGHHPLQPPPVGCNLQHHIHRSTRLGSTSRLQSPARSNLIMERKTCIRTVPGVNSVTETLQGHCPRVHSQARGGVTCSVASAGTQNSRTTTSTDKDTPQLPQGAAKWRGQVPELRGTVTSMSVSCLDHRRWSTSACTSP